MDVMGLLSDLEQTLGSREALYGVIGGAGLLVGGTLGYVVGKFQGNRKSASQYGLSLDSAKSEITTLIRSEISGTRELITRQLRDLYEGVERVVATRSQNLTTDLAKTLTEQSAGIVRSIESMGKQLKKLEFPPATELQSPASIDGGQETLSVVAEPQYGKGIADDEGQRIKRELLAHRRQ